MALNDHLLGDHQLSDRGETSQRIPSSPRVSVDTATVARLVAENFPELAGLRVSPVTKSGWDNHTFRVGDEFKARLPASATYISQCDKEVVWLPKLAPYVPVQIPVPVGKGRPGHGYPFHWSVWRWIDGETVNAAGPSNRIALSEDIARFLNALLRCPTNGAPLAGPDNFYRGGDLGVYDQQTRECLARLTGIVDAERLAAIWSEALSTRWERPPVWVHGDVAAGNLVVSDETLKAVIDFGSSACGDPACDLVANWTLFDRDSRAHFRQHYSADGATWARARGWCLWKSVLVMAENLNSETVRAREFAVLKELVSDIDEAGLGQSGK